MKTLVFSARVCAALVWLAACAGSGLALAQGYPYYPPPGTLYNSNGAVALGTATGGLQTAGTLNAQGLFINGVAVQVVPCAVNNAVVYANASGVLTCATSLQYDGANTVSLGNNTGNAIYRGAAAATVTGAGQATQLNGGAGGATSGNGGNATVNSGAATDGNSGAAGVTTPNAATTTAANRNSGLILIQSGNGINAGTSGTATLKTGNGGATGNSGAVSVTSGNGGATSGTSGGWSGSTGTTAGVGNRSGNLTFGTGNATNAGAGNIQFNLGVSGTPAACAGGAGTCPSVLFQQGGQDYVIFDYLANFVFDPQTAFTSASNDGFLWIPMAAGAPTGTPTAYNSDYIHSAPIYYDTGSSRLYAYNFTGAAWRNVADFPTSANFANPTAAATLTAVNGTATTYMRSDAAPALSLGIAPNIASPWTASPWVWSNAEPRLVWSESDQAADLKNWDCDVNAGVFACRTRTDADGTGVNFLAVTRGTTTAVTNISLGNATNNPTFNMLGTGGLTIGGGLTASDANLGNVNITGTNIPTVGLSKSGGGSLLLNAAGVTGASVSSGTNKVFNVNFAVISVGTKPTVTGCSNTTTLGGAVSGSYVSGTTGTCTVTITLPAGPTNGYACFAHDDTTAADYTQSAIVTTVTTLTISGTTVTGDKIVWGCAFGY